jgi:ribosomal protein S18 acetylase RimI-like enzyme
MSTSRPYTLRPMVAPDTEAVLRLWDRQFGGDPETQQNWMEAVLSPTHSAIATVAVPPTDDTVVAFGLLDVAAPAHTRQYLSLDALDRNASLASQNGIFHMYCVHPTWEGRGIGTALYGRHLQSLAARGIRRAVGIAWHRPHTVDSRVLFEKHAFTRLATVERFYDRFQERAHCPDCTGSCTCTASLYVRATGCD